MDEQRLTGSERAERIRIRLADRILKLLMAGSCVLFSLLALVVAAGLVGGLLAFWRWISGA